MYICILVMKRNADKLIEITIPPQNVLCLMFCQIMFETSCT